MHRGKFNMTDIQNTNNKTYAVAIVFSRWKLGRLCAFLEDELGARQEQIGFMRIDRYKGRETNRTILLLERSLFDTADSRGFTSQQKDLDFKIVEYELREHNFPRKGYTRNFYIPIPLNLPEDEARAQIQNKIDVLVTFGLFLKEQAPRLKIPLKSRETGEHRGQAFVTFSRATDDDSIALARILLHDTRLYMGTDDDNWERMRCVWAKDKQTGASGNNGKRKGGRRGNKKSLKAVPAKKGLIKTNTGPGQEDVPASVIKPLAPGENQWNKPLIQPPDVGTDAKVKEDDTGDEVSSDTASSDTGTDESTDRDTVTVNPVYGSSLPPLN